jgi:transcriptional regulator with XRE-family HTH domain
MEKSIYTDEYAVALELLRQARARAGLTQIELAEQLGTTQSIVSKYERGELRLDIIQLRTFCRVLGSGLPEFTAALEARLNKGEKHRSRSRER